MGRYKINEKYEKFLELIFYQIYPKSFMDANNDGIGDFNGIIQKIPYLAELGVNGVWLSPCYKSPGVDSGYDISDYTDVGEEFGTLDDFKRMLDCFHSYGIKVIVDLVVNHCSTEHMWFKEAKKSRDNPYHDYFYWFDEKPNDYDIIHRYFSENQIMYEKNDLIFAPFFENHDQCRCVSKFADDKKLRFESATFFATILYTLKGTPFILQGQGFGTPDAYYDSIDYFDDAETIGFYNEMKNEISEEELIELINKDSRDNGRHPMAWNGEINGGFNNGAKPWLPVHSRVDEINLERDRKNDKSIFEYYKKLIALRKSSKALIYGVFDDMTKDRKDCFIYTRTYGDEKIAIICNYDKSSVIDVPTNYEKITGNYDEETNGVFRPFEAVIYRVRNESALLSAEE